MAVFSTAVFAAPLSLAGSLATSSKEVASRIEGFSNSDDLFANVQAVAPTDREAQAVKREGLFGSLIGAARGAVVGSLVSGIKYL
jgi:hypothetical protein